MPKLIAMITALAGLAWAVTSLQRSGFNIDVFNPFYWYRRYQWHLKYGRNPLYTLDKPMDAAAVLLVGIARLDGEISREQKNEIIAVFATEFHLGEEAAKELFVSSAFLLQNETNLAANAGKVLERSLGQFTTEQAESTLALLKRIANLDNHISSTQQDLIAAVEKILSATQKGAKGKWG